MKTLLHLAISKDGFIARENGDSSWVSTIDEKLFLQHAKEAGYIVIGRKTFDQYKDQIYPIPDITNIVLTQDTGYTYPGILIAESPAAAYKIAKDKGCSKLLIAGGKETAQAFIKANLIDEIFLTIHPITLGTGMRVFEEGFLENNARLVEKKDLGDGIMSFLYIFK